MKHIPLYEDFKNLNEKVTVDTSRYERSHGKKPRGRGAWAFYFDRSGGEALFTPHSMDYKDAIKWAKEQAKEAGKTVIYVGESVNESLNEGFTSFADLEIAIRHHKDGNPYYDMTKLINVYNGLKSSDQIKAKKKYSDIFGVKESEVKESVNEIKKGSVVIPYAMDKYGEFTVDKVFKNKDGETSYSGKFKKNGETREFILHPKDKLVNESKKLTSSQLSNFLLDLIYTAAQYTSEDLESLAGQSPRDLDDAIKMVLDYIPSSKKKKFIDDAEKMIQLKKLDESRRSIIHPVIMQQRYLRAKSNANLKKLVLPNISDIDHTRIVKWMGIHYYSNQYDIMMKGKDLEIVFKKMSSQEIERLKDYLKSQDYLKESNNIDVTQLKVGRILHFKDGEEWKITKIIGNPKNPRGVLALPHGDTKKGYVSVAIEFSIDDLENSLSNIFPGK